MLEETIARIERELQADLLEPERKAELLRLLSTLRSEVNALSLTHSEQAQSVAGFAALSTHEATRAKRRPQLLEFSLRGLAASAQELEVSHPRLVEVVNRICTMLSNMGI
jgi:queuine/archaeosine tRNA-ribosyltransferase